MADEEDSGLGVLGVGRGRGEGRGVVETLGEGGAFVLGVIGAAFEAVGRLELGGLGFEGELFLHGELDWRRSNDEEIIIKREKRQFMGNVGKMLDDWNNQKDKGRMGIVLWIGMGFSGRCIWIGNDKTKDEKGDI